MNPSFKAAALLAFAFAACAPAQADDGLALRIANSAGAAQGNAALAEIRRELKASLLSQLKPLLPQAVAVAPAAPMLAQR